ncbi:MAG: 1-deoxy-D-xylulose-5-phosphate synthase [Sedimentisphaerales bacterium]|nr:1-deoxy-D-xylulose-5-phosphate synthase [Sedimentisphaerales bacterium]
MGILLEQNNGPDDLKKLSINQLSELAEEIRQLILASVSKTGGHLASNLGVVELTLALHYVFNFKADKLIWDVGHQCYTHKIITGRKNGFERLRQSDGISGFPDPSESEYDQFTVGHAGTSISTAIGMALGQKQLNKADKIVAFVGDASIVNGTSFEALNNLGLVKRQLLIVLNDNSMAIDATQGALAKYFSKVRLSQTYEDLRRTTKNILEHMPVIGKSVEDAIERIKKSIRMVLPASQMFESLNIPYFGPVDGHEIGSLIKLFKALGDFNSPAILHIYTQKGKGFSPANKHPSKFHSTGSFKINGQTVEAKETKAGRTFTDVFGEHLVKLAEKDERIVAITSAMCDGTGLMGFREKFTGRFYDVGIAEGAAVDIAAGLAKSGLRPVVCMYSTFLQRSLDQIAQEVSLQNLPVVFCIDRAGVVGADGPTHHGLMDIGYMRMMPNMVLTAPANAIELREALEFALSQQGPVCLRYPKDVVPSVLEIDNACFSQPFELGKSVAVRYSEQAVISVVTYGCVLSQGLAAAERLAGEGIEINVINARFADPVDEGIISLLDKGNSLITVEDHSVACGFGSAVLEKAVAMLGRVPEPIVVIGGPARFIRRGSRSAQLMQEGVNADEIVRVAKEILVKFHQYNTVSPKKSI